MLICLCSDADFDQFLVTACLERLKRGYDNEIFASKLIAQVEGCFSPRTRHHINDLIRKELGEERLDGIQARRRWGMWMSLAATTSISGLSGAALYCLSVMLTNREAEASCSTTAEAEPLPLRRRGKWNG